MNFATRYGRDWNAKVVLYLLAIMVALRSSRIADAVFVVGCVAFADP